jgi:two-component system nitrogen regulation response regulator GlnG
MPNRSSALNLLLLTTDSDLQEQLKRTLKDAAITVSRDLESVPKSTRRFDGVILETRRGGSELSDVQRFADPHQTFVVAGSRTVLSHAVGLMNGGGHHTNGSAPAGLDDYLESKLGEFVKGMKSSAAQNLHPMLITAVEKPLIALALRETNGNQIQAADLLGMNRNTLRKKITAFRIPVKRERGRRRR